MIQERLLELTPFYTLRHLCPRDTALSYMQLISIMIRVFLPWKRYNTFNKPLNLI